MSASLCTDKEQDISVSESSRQWRQIIPISPKTFCSSDSSFPLKTDTEANSEFTGTISRLQLSEGVTELQDAVSGTRKEEPGNRPAPLWLTSHMEAPEASESWSSTEQEHACTGEVDLPEPARHQSWLAFMKGAVKMPHLSILRGSKRSQRAFHISFGDAALGTKWALSLSSSC